MPENHISKRNFSPLKPYSAGRPSGWSLLTAWVLLIACVLLAIWTAGAEAQEPLGEEPELLEPERAFPFTTAVVSAGDGAETLSLRFSIPPGYYLYRDKFKFAAQTPGLELGAPVLPAGRVKQDEFFGRVEVYRGEVAVSVPAERPAGAREAAVNITVQGCADAGVCYPPLTRRAVFTFPQARAADPAGSAAGESGRGATADAPTTAPAGKSGAAPEAKPSGLQSLLGGLASLGGQDEFLPPDRAFQLRVQVIAPDRLRASFDLAPGYYLYRDKIRFTFADTNPGPKVEKVDLPAAEPKDDPTFGKTWVYHDDFSADITLSAPAPAGPLSLSATYQGCADAGVCYPPITHSYALDFATTSVVAGADAARSDAAAGTAPAGLPVSESSRVERLLQGGSFWLIIAGFFGFGLLLALTPCVFPMIPILSGIIVGQGAAVTKGRGFALSVAYVLGMAITYAAAGVAAGLSGGLLASSLQNPWVLGGFALVFVLLALSMFGFYELQLPSGLQSRFSSASNRVPGGKFSGVFLMGALSALIVGPCVAAPLAGALLYISQTRDVWLGGSALFAMALGMGVPLLLVGLSAGALLPRAGAWMNSVKHFFGVLLLGVAIWLVSPVLPAVAHMLLWAALLIVSGVYLRALDPLPPTARGWDRLWKGTGVIALLAGAALLVGVAAGGRDVLQPLAGLVGTSGEGRTGSEELPFERVGSVAELDAKLAAAGGKLVMLDFYADWCVSCKEMERFTFSDPEVQAALAGAVLLQADVTADNANDQALLRRFQLFGPPGIIFFDGRGREIADARVIGFLPAERFLATVRAVTRAGA